MECALRYPTRLGFGALLLASVSGTILYAAAPATPHSHYGALSSASYLGIPILFVFSPRCPQDACRGAVALSAAQITYPSALTWVYKRFWSWPADARDGAGVDNNNVWYLDTFSMLTLACAALALSTQHAIGMPRVSLAAAGVLLCALHAALRVERLPFTSHVDDAVGALLAAAVLGVVAAQRKHTTAIWPAVGGLCAMAPLWYVVRLVTAGTAAPPHTYDAVALYWHIAVATLLALLVSHVPGPCFARRPIVAAHAAMPLVASLQLALGALVSDPRTFYLLSGLVGCVYAGGVLVANERVRGAGTGATGPPGGAGEAFDALS